MVSDSLNEYKLFGKISFDFKNKTKEPESVIIFTQENIFSLSLKLESYFHSCGRQEGRVFEDLT